MFRKSVQVVAAATSMALAMTACGPQEADTSVAVSEGSDPHPTVMAHKYQRNPAPGRRYDITLAITDAPGPFGSVEGFAQYEAPNCVFTLDSIAGVHSIPRHRMPVTYRKLDDSTYVGTIYLDAMLDEDYFANGICHWQFTSTTAVLKATGAHAETGFAPSFELEEALAQKSMTKYFWKERYPRESIEDYSEFGRPSAENFKSEIRDNLFTITLTPKEVRP